MPAQPLASAGSAAPAIPPSDPVAQRKTNQWTDPTVARKPLPYRSERQVGPLPTQRMQQISSQLCVELGFPVVMDSPPIFPKKPKPGAPTPWFEGVTVGERSLNMDLARRRTAFRWFGALLAISMGLLVGGLLVTTYDPTSPAVLALLLPAGMLLAGSIIALNGIGSFDSDILCVRYLGSAADPTAPPLSPDAPAVFAVTIQSGRVASANWSSKTGSGRDFKAVLPGHEELTTFPDAATRRLGSLTS
jgi:hypothetical protein